VLEGVNSRLDTLQAAFLGTKLKYLDTWNQQRNHAASLYDELLKDIPELVLPKIGPSRKSVYHLYVVQTERRDELLKFLHEQDIMAGIHYPIPLHLQPALHYLNYKEGDFPIAERLAKQCLSLPMFAELTEAEIHTVAKACHSFFKR
jgi:dTDP-4-amino-4,6-dideoxygalactose transaminase